MLNLADDWPPWAGLVAPGLVLNKDGSFARTQFRFRGPDLDSATQGELVATSARLNNALRRRIGRYSSKPSAGLRPTIRTRSFPSAVGGGGRTPGRSRGIG